MKRIAVLSAILVVVGAIALVQAQQNPPKELGVIEWNRGFDEAAKLAEQNGKPILILFQEVPG